MKKRYGLPYKGSKVRMLKQGLGAELTSLIKPETTTFVDLFCGGLSVSDYMDDNTNLNIISNDADPPYKNTDGYSAAFDSDAFWQWCREQPFPVYVSEISAPDDFTSIWSKDFCGLYKEL